jgi:hypothetical protein
MLKFKNSQERHLFWMQEADASKDEETKKKVGWLEENKCTFTINCIWDSIFFLRGRMKIKF